jgi:nucleotide-binding universal stress UspA family protein
MDEKRERQSRPCQQAALLIATDGLSPSDGALAFAKSLPLGLRSSVMVLSVVNEAPIPWGNVDRGLIVDYQRELYADAMRRALSQVARVGRAEWKVEVRYGNPGDIIAAVAKECGARLVLLGLGDHSVSARIFGNETALKAMRNSRVPVLAVDASLTAPPKRIVVGMDFREASIEAARTALRFAAPDATLILAHAIPWERKEYIPEKWLSDYEAHVTEQLFRVGGWLAGSGSARIEHRILYGRPGAALPALAEKVNADLLVSGTHPHNSFARVVFGETLSRLVRGANRSLLVLPASAAFSSFDTVSAAAPPVAAEPEWPAKLDQFTRRNAARFANLEVEDRDLGAQVEMHGYRFLGASYDPPTRRAQLMFGASEVDGPHLSRGISNVKSIEVLAGGSESADAALSIVSDAGQTLVLFQRTAEGS